MAKKVFIGLGAFVLVLILIFVYLNYRSRNLSPPGIAELNVNNLHVEIGYSRPLEAA